MGDESVPSTPPPTLGAMNRIKDFQETHRHTYGQLISGGVAGCVAKTLTAPLSR